MLPQAARDSPGIDAAKKDAQSGADNVWDSERIGFQVRSSSDLTV